MPPIVVRAPATSANLGSGFDCLGLALDLWNEVSATPGAFQPDDADNLILQAARTLFDETDARYPGFTLECSNRIPFGRGLGSSSAAIACGLLLANRCLGDPHSPDALLRLATRIEGHPDNVAPCFLGGIRVATVGADGSIAQARVPAALSLTAVVFVPEQSVPTVHARGLLPASVPMADAVFNLARSSLFVAALAAGRPELLAEGMRDRLHQPYRLPLFPAGATLLDTAMQSGALGACISGAGPSVLALCASPAQADAVAAAFAATAHTLDVAGDTLRLALTDRGAYVAD